MKIVDQTHELGGRHSALLIAEDECDERVLRDFAGVIRRARERDKMTVLDATILQEVGEHFPSLLLAEVYSARMPNYEPRETLPRMNAPRHTENASPSQLEAARAAD